MSKLTLTSQVNKSPPPPPGLLSSHEMDYVDAKGVTRRYRVRIEASLEGQLHQASFQEWKEFETPLSAVLKDAEGKVASLFDQKRIELISLPSQVTIGALSLPSNTAFQTFIAKSSVSKVTPPVVPVRRGIPNADNDCWLNAPLQLLHNDRWAMQEIKKLPAGNPLREFMQKYDSNEPLPPSKSLRSFVEIGTANPSSQEDAGEMIRNVLHHFPKTGKYHSKKGLPPLFGEAGYFILSLLPPYSLEALVKDQWEIEEAPSSLWLHVQRSGETGKNKAPVTAPDTLSIAGKDYQFDGFIRHLGKTVSSGHYIAYSLERATNQWFEYNDDKIRPVGLPEIEPLIKEGSIFHYTH
jgi:hypothetical protein